MSIRNRPQFNHLRHLTSGEIVGLEVVIRPFFNPEETL